MSDNTTAVARLYTLPATQTLHPLEVTKFLIRSPLGELPLIISVPHGGLQQSTDRPRKRGVADMDDFTMALGLALYHELCLTASPPSLVALGLNRKWADVNRGEPYSPLSKAYDGPDGKHAYTEFHGTIAQMIGDYHKRGLSPLLIDLHGNSEPPLRGAVEPAVGGATGRFLPQLTRAYGRHAKEFLWAQPHGLFHGMAQEGLHLYQGPPIFDGGYTVRHYSAVHGIDCIQLEFHRDYRTSTEKASETGQRLGRALAPFLARYPAPPLPHDRFDLFPSAAPMAPCPPSLSCVLIPLLIKLFFF